MDSKPQKPSFLFSSPFTAWTELAFKLWGFGKPQEDSAETPVAVAVIPTRDAESPPPAKAARAQSKRKRAQGKVRIKGKAKHTRR